VTIGAFSAEAVEDESGTVTAPEPQLRRRLGRADLRGVSESRRALRELLCQWGGGRDRPGIPDGTAHGPNRAWGPKDSDAANGSPVLDVSEVSDVAELLTSELVTNALIHTDHDAVLTATVGPGGLRVEVRDFVTRRPRLCVPDPDEGTNGRGLFLVQSLADAWGVRAHGVGKSVWFELDVA
jgi:hypothetical protein